MLELLRDGYGVEPWAPTGEVVRLRFDGDEILLAVNREAEEISRRRQHGLGALTHRRALQVILSMPRGVAVPLDLLRSADQRVLDALPPGVVEMNEADARVLLSPAVSLLSVGLIGRTWKQGLRISSRFASYCARYIVLDGRRLHSDTTLATIEARYFGVGLAEHRDGCLNWLVSPAPFQADRFTAASWLMAERLTEALSELDE